MKITALCKKYGRLPSNFLSTKVCRGVDGIKVDEGCEGGTVIPDILCKPFFLWLSIETRNMITSGIDIYTIEQFVKSKT